MNFKFSRIVLVFIFFASISHGHEKKWPEKRLRQAWPEAQSFTSKQVSLTSSQISQLKSEDIQIGAQDRSPTFYFPEELQDKKPKKVGLILFVDGAGVNRVMEMSIAMGLDGRVTKVDLWEQSEGALLAKADFLKQFIGKNANDSFVANKDYQPAAGAEKASEAIANAVKKALKIANIVFEKK